MSTKRLWWSIGAVSIGRPAFIALSAVALVLAVSAGSTADDIVFESARLTESPATELPALESSAAETPEYKVDEQVLRYLPDECHLFCQLTVASILKSEFVRECSYGGADPTKMLNVTLAPLGLEVEDIDRVFLGARKVNEDSIGQYVAIVFCNKPFERPAQVLSGGNVPWQESKVGKHVVWDDVVGGSLSMCAVEDRILLVGERGTLRAVLKRDKPARLPRRRDSSWTLHRSAGDLVVSYFPPEGQPWPVEQSLPLAADVLKRIAAVGMEVTFGKDFDVQISALCDDAQLAAHLCQIVEGLSALLELQDPDSQVPQLRNLIKSVHCKVDGQVVTADMTVPHSLVALASFGGSSLSVPWSAGQPTWSTTPNLCPTGPEAVAYPQFPAGASGIVPSSPYCSPPSYSNSQPQYGATPYPPVRSPSVPPIYDPYGTTPSTGNYSLVSPKVPVFKIEDLKRLMKASVDKEVIMRHFRKHQLEAPLSVDDLILLTELEVGVEIITMLQGLSTVPPSCTPAPGNSPPLPQPVMSANMPSAVPPSCQPCQVPVSQGPAANNVPTLPPTTALGRAPLPPTTGFYAPFVPSTKPLK